MLIHVLALGLVSAAAPSANGPDMIVKTVRVSYADLDLTTVAGRAALERRLKRATRNVCGPEMGTDWLADIQFGRCKAAAEAGWRPLASRAEEAANHRRDEKEARLAARR